MEPSEDSPNKAKDEAVTGAEQKNANDSGESEQLSHKEAMSIWRKGLAEMIEVLRSFP